MARDHVMNNDWSPRASSASKTTCQRKAATPKNRRWNSQPVMMRSVRQVLQCEASYSGICCMIFGFYGLSEAHEQWGNDCNGVDREFCGYWFCGYWLGPIWNELVVARLFTYEVFASLFLLLSNQKGWLCSQCCLYWVNVADLMSKYGSWDYSWWALVPFKTKLGSTREQAYSCILTCCDPGQLFT